MTSPPSSAFCPFHIERFSFTCLSELTRINRRISDGVYEIVIDSQGNEIPWEDHVSVDKGITCRIFGFNSRWPMQKELINGRYYFKWFHQYYISTIPKEPQLRALGIMNWEQVFPFGDDR